MARIYRILICTILSTTLGWGQSAVSISTTQDTILFGDQINIQLQVRSSEIPSIKELVFPIDSFSNLVLAQMQDAGDEYADVSVLGRNETGGNIIISPDEFNGTDPLNLSIQMFSLGVFSIKSPKIVYKDGRVITPFDSVVVFVTAPDYLFQDTTMEIQDIRSIIEIEKTFYEKIKPYFNLLLALGAMALLYYLFTKRKPKEIVEEEEKVVVIDPKVEALERLDKLRKEQPWLRGEYKHYQDEISFVLRNYMERNNEINALEMTTSEIQNAMNDFGAPLNKYSTEINELLSIADMVKFAKATPTDDIYASFIDRTKAFVEAVYNQPIADEE